jgi:putative ABC transport system substrate-binding protein
MRRRELATALGALMTLSGVARAQSAPVRIGFLPLGSETDGYDKSNVAAFKAGFLDVGLIEGRDILLDTVWIANEPDIPRVVNDLLQRGARLLVTAGSSASAAARSVTSTVPIVFVSVGNPVGIGLVRNLARPGGNMTGLSDVLDVLSSKYVDFAMQLGPPKAPVHYLWHTAWPDGRHRYNLTESATRTVGIELHARGIAAIEEASDAIAELRGAGTRTIVVQPSPFTYRHRVRLIEAARRERVGMIFAWPISARDGAIIAYGSSYGHMHRRAATFVARILRGMSPNDIPVEEPTVFELAVNLKAARALDIQIPAALVTVADELIE